MYTSQTTTEEKHKFLKKSSYTPMKSLLRTKYKILVAIGEDQMVKLLEFDICLGKWDDELYTMQNIMYLTHRKQAQIWQHKMSKSYKTMHVNLYGNYYRLNKMVKDKNTY